jgi:hypothetical protein
LLMFDVGSREAIPIDAWVDESANGVIAESADLELGPEIESEGDDKTERDDGDESSPDAVPLREPEESAPAPEVPEQRPDLECESGTAGDGDTEETSESDTTFNSI